MMPVLRARETIREVNALAFAFGSLPKNKADEFVFTLNVTAAMSSESAPKVYRPKNPQELASLSGGTTTIKIG